VWIGINLAGQINASTIRARDTVAFAELVADIRGHPYSVNLGNPNAGEVALAIDVYLTGVPSSGPCVEIAILAEPDGRCPTAVRYP
jgi:hypothetical protein